MAQQTKTRTEEIGRIIIHRWQRTLSVLDQTLCRNSRRHTWTLRSQRNRLQLSEMSLVASIAYQGRGRCIGCKRLNKPVKANIEACSSLPGVEENRCLEK